MAQIQQLQAQQQQRQDQNQRPNVAATVPNRPTRPTGIANTRPVNSQQAQILQQARALQIPVQLQAGGQTNLVSLNYPYILEVLDSEKNLYICMLSFLSRKDCFKAKPLETPTQETLFTDCHRI